MLNRKLLFIGGGAFSGLLTALNQTTQIYDLNVPYEWVLLGARVLPAVLGGMLAGYILMRVTVGD